MPSVRLTYATPKTGTTKHGLVVDGVVTIDPALGVARGAYRNLITDDGVPGYDGDPAPENETTSFQVLLTDADLLQILGIVAARAMATGGLVAVASSSIDPTTSAPPEAVSVTLELRPGDVVVGTTVPLIATVRGAANTAVTWYVLDTGGGSIDAQGVYTAPATPGRYRVGAVSVADASKSAVLTIDVVAAAVP